MEEKVRPIKDRRTLQLVQDTLLNQFEYGRRNLTIFQVGKGTLLRCSDVLGIKYDEVFDEHGRVKTSTFIHDQKTGKPNHVYLTPVQGDLVLYRD